MSSIHDTLYPHFIYASLRSCWLYLLNFSQRHAFLTICKLVSFAQPHLSPLCSILFASLKQIASRAYKLLWFHITLWGSELLLWLWGPTCFHPGPFSSFISSHACSCSPSCLSLTRDFSTLFTCTTLLPTTGPLHMLFPLWVLLPLSFVSSSF